MLVVVRTATIAGYEQVKVEGKVKAEAEEGKDPPPP